MQVMSVLSKCFSIIVSKVVVKQSCGLKQSCSKTEFWYKTVKVEIVFFVIFQPEIWNCRNLFYSNKTNLVKLSQSFQL